MTATRLADCKGDLTGSVVRLHLTMSLFTSPSQYVQQVGTEAAQDLRRQSGGPSWVAQVDSEMLFISI